MDRVATAQAVLNDLVCRVGEYFARGGPPGIETSILTDAEHGQYGLLRIGWEPGTGRRVLDTVFLARIRNGKVWIEENNTDLPLADELVRAGVPREDIVLAFHPPEVRRLGEFAVS